MAVASIVPQAINGATYQMDRHLKLSIGIRVQMVGCLRRCQAEPVESSEERRHKVPLRGIVSRDLLENVPSDRFLQVLASANDELDIISPALSTSDIIAQSISEISTFKTLENLRR